MEERFWELITRFRRINQKFIEDYNEVFNETLELFKEVGIPPGKLRKFKEAMEMFRITLLKYNEEAVHKLIEQIVEYLIFGETREQFEVKIK